MHISIAFNNILPHMTNVKYSYYSDSRKETLQNKVYDFFLVSHLSTQAEYMCNGIFGTEHLNGKINISMPF